MRISKKGFDKKEGQMIERTKADVYQTKMRCAKCKEAYMEHTGLCKAVYPPLYELKCHKCGDIITSKKIYPYTEFVVKNGTWKDKILIVVAIIGFIPLLLLALGPFLTPDLPGDGNGYGDGTMIWLHKHDG